MFEDPIPEHLCHIVDIPLESMATILHISHGSVQQTGISPEGWKWLEDNVGEKNVDWMKDDLVIEDPSMLGDMDSESYRVVGTRFYFAEPDKAMHFKLIYS